MTKGLTITSLVLWLHAGAIMEHKSIYVRYRSLQHRFAWHSQNFLLPKESSAQRLDTHSHDRATSTQTIHSQLHYSYHRSQSLHLLIRCNLEILLGIHNEILWHILHDPETDVGFGKSNDVSVSSTGKEVTQGRMELDHTMQYRL